MRPLLAKRRCRSYPVARCRLDASPGSTGWMNQPVTSPLHVRFSSPPHWRRRARQGPVPQWLGEFASSFPGVEVHLDIADTRDIEDSLIRRRVDVAVVGEYDAGAELVTTTLGSDVLLPICAPGQEDMLTLDSFLQQRFIAREEGSSTREIFERWLRDRGLRLRPAMEVASTEAVKQVVAAGLGVSVVSDATIQLELKAGVLASPPTEGFPIK